MRNTLVGLGWRTLAYVSIGLGAAGLVVPLLPTTPFLLLAAWAAPKASPRLAHWLWQHPRMGPILQAWRHQRAVPRRAKWLTAVLLALSWLLLWLGSAPNHVLITTAAIFCCVVTFVLTRPDATPRGSERHQVSTAMIRRF
ncbi:YbaN family protein [Billgrantia sulfidoxydans]|uniref:YbaN family protein n=1 Tax=Billgrantia sulfidoxydans TaxID=2733484 RepID=A0ABX7VYW8_9GAMM|nr:YbaN family protein [Halomonas sulfidoxydans]QTP53320.1 YbaN family protein [Halomonas sulfidoxydans]